MKLLATVAVILAKLPLITLAINCFNCAQTLADAKVLSLLNSSFLMPPVASYDCNDYPKNGSNINVDSGCPISCFSVTNYDAKAKRTMTIRGCTDWLIKSAQWAVMSPFTPTYLPAKCYIGWIGSSYVSSAVSGNSYFCFCNSTNCNSVTSIDATAAIKTFLASGVSKLNTAPLLHCFLLYLFLALSI